MSNILSEISLYDTIYKLKDDNAAPTSRTVNGKALTSDIALSFSDVGADKSGAAATAEANAKTYADSTANNKISTHNTATNAHNDIRVLIADLKEQLENFLDVDDTTVDQLSEVLTLINNNKGTLESLTTTKVNVSDIINNLTTNSSNKVLSAAQGVAIKALIDALQDELDAYETQLNSLPKIYVQTNEPTNPKDGDLWVDTDDAEQTVLAAVATSGSFNDLINKPTYGISNITGLQTALDAKANTSALSSYLPLSGGTMTGELKVNGGDKTGGSKIVLETGKGQITNSGTSTLFGYTAAGTIAVGHSSAILAMRGNGTRPKYNSNDLALKSDIDSAVANLANKADIATTVMRGFSNSAAIYIKISDFGAWGTGNWTQKGFSMLLTSRGGEMIWLALAADDSNTNAKAIRLLNTYSKITNIYYVASESAIYAKMNAWCNNICAHVLSNVSGDYVPVVAQASALPSDAVEIKIAEFGATSAGVAVGNSSGTLTLTGSGAAPTYNGANLATEAKVQEMINAIAVYNGSVS